jgi:hypothetical protein
MKPEMTLVDLLIRVVIGCVFLAIVAGGVFKVSSGCSGIDHQYAESEARRWSQQMGIEPVGVSCANVDSDGDGYVSCTVSSRRPDGKVDLHPVECAVRVSINSGCRSQRAGVWGGVKQ